MAVTSALLALLIEAAVGYPSPLWRAIGHPVTWIGAAIATLEHWFNRASASPRVRRLAGVAVLAVVAGGATIIAFFVERMLLPLPFGTVGVALLASTLLAQRSLHDHVARVACALEEDGIVGGR